MEMKSQGQNTKKKLLSKKLSSKKEQIITENQAHMQWEVSNNMVNLLMDKDNSIKCNQDKILTFRIREVNLKWIHGTGNNNNQGMGNNLMGNSQGMGNSLMGNQHMVNNDIQIYILVKNLKKSLIIFIF